MHSSARSRHIIALSAAYIQIYFLLQLLQDINYKRHAPIFSFYIWASFYYTIQLSHCSTSTVTSVV